MASTYRTSAVYVTCLVLATAALIIVALGHPFVGIAAFGSILVLAGVLRTVVSVRTMGPLVVRSRSFDAVAFIGLGAAMIVLAQSLRTVH